MKNEISELLKGISKDEFEKFGDFIKSPYFNKLPRLVKLYDYISGKYFSEGIDSITRESISSYMYSRESFKNESVRKLLSDFWKLLERFLAQEEFEKNEWDKNVLILRGLRKSRYDDKFFKMLKKVKYEHKNSTQQIDEFYKTCTNLISEEYDYYFNTNPIKNNSINQEKSQALDLEFIANKLYLFQYMLSREYINRDLKFTYDFFEEITQYILQNRKKIIKDNPEIYRNFLGVKFIKGNAKKTLSELKLFISEQKYFSKGITKPYWDFINLCMLKINTGEDIYFNDVFHYVNLLDKHNLISQDKAFNHNCFRITTSAALYCREFDWLKSFTVKYQSKIEKEYRDDIVNLTYAKLYFERQENDKSKEYCQKITYKNYLFYLSAKYILFKIAYLQNDIINLTTLKDAYIKYFDSHTEIPSIFKSGKIEFVNYIIELGKIREKNELQKNDEFEIDRFLKKINEDKVVNSKEWLISEAKKLKSS